MAANTMLKRVGERTQPCFTPFVTGNESEVSLLSRTMALIPSCNCRTSAVNFLGRPNFSIITISHSPSLQTVSNALVKSMHVMKRSSYCSWYFSCSWLAAKIMSPVLQRPRQVTYITTDYSYFNLQCCDPKRHTSCHTGRVHVHFRCSRLCERVFNLFIVSQGERGGLVG